MATTPPMADGVGQCAPLVQAVPPSYASLGRRVAAYVVDVMIAFCMVFVAGTAMRILHAAGLWTPVTGDPIEIWRSLGIGAKLTVVLAYVLAMGPVYFALFESSPWQATFGKRLLTVYVTGNDGKRVSPSRSFGRWLARFFCSWFAGSLVSILTIATTTNRKALHDYLAGTLVLKGRPAPGGSLEPWRMVVAFGPPFLGVLGMYLSVLGAF